jgi:hypothetical protein
MPARAMDVVGLRSYVTIRMNLLLLLSAMLSALTGAVASGRGERQQSAVFARVETQRAEPARTAVASLRPDAGPLRPSPMAARPASFRLSAIEPLFASRRRE